MKNLFFLTMTTLLLLIACGKKENESGSASRFSTDPYKVSTLDGYLNPQSPVFETSNQTYQISQQSYQVLNQAFQLAQQQGIQPRPINGAYKYRARVTGSLNVSNLSYPYQQNYQYPNQVSNSSALATLNVQSAVIIR